MSETLERCDVAVVGAGIVGLAHAYCAAKRGLSVAVIERHAQARGASVRNFGMVWPIGQAGAAAANAHRSRRIWGAMLHEAAIWHDACGSLHVAHHPDEMATLREFAERAGGEFDLELLTADETLRRFPRVNRDGLEGALFSAGELCVDPRATLAGLPEFLAAKYGVRIHFETLARRVREGIVETHRGEVVAGAVFICSGDETQTLFPEFHAESGLVPVKLQMMRATAPAGWSMGTLLAGGLTLLHYPSFQGCPSQQDVRERFERSHGEHLEWGIHGMVSQHAGAHLTLGDSHEYGSFTPFSHERVDQMILDYISTLIDVPRFAISSRWHGVYLKHPERWHLTHSPCPGVQLVVGLGGAGMTQSFGVADTNLAALEGTASSSRLQR